MVDLAAVTQFSVPIAFSYNHPLGTTNPQETNTNTRFMVMVKASRNSEAGHMPCPKLLADMGKFNEMLAKAGVLVSGDGLQPGSKGARVRFTGKKRTLIDGPFAETKELVAGFGCGSATHSKRRLTGPGNAPTPRLARKPSSSSARFSKPKISQLHPCPRSRPGQTRL